MVFFSCEGCNETLKKAQVENHIRRCGCPVSCVDCSKVFPGMTYAQHTSCISEAEKYEKSLYKGPKGGGKKKRDPQAEWMDLIGAAAAEVDASGEGGGGGFSPLVKGSLRRMADLGNVPRNEKKFKNFLSNSLRINRPQEQDELWQFLRKRAEAAAAAAGGGGASNGKEADGQQQQKQKEEEKEKQNGHAAKTQGEDKAEPRSSSSSSKEKKKEKKEKRKAAAAVGEGETKSGPHAEPAVKKQKQQQQAEEAASAGGDCDAGGFAWEKTIKKLVKAASKAPDGGGIGLKALQSQVVALALEQQQQQGDKKALKKLFKAKVAATPGVAVRADGTVAYAKEKKA